MVGGKLMLKKLGSEKWKTQEVGKKLIAERLNKATVEGVLFSVTGT